MELPHEASEVIVHARPMRYYRDDAVRWVWIFYGLSQACVTMLMAFSVIEGTTVAAVITAVALIIYVGINEILVRPYRARPARPKSVVAVLPADQEESDASITRVASSDDVDQ